MVAVIDIGEKLPEMPGEVLVSSHDAKMSVYTNENEYSSCSTIFIVGGGGTDALKTL